MATALFARRCTLDDALPISIDELDLVDASPAARKARKRQSLDYDDYEPCFDGGMAHERKAGSLPVCPKAQHHYERAAELYRRAAFFKRGDFPATCNRAQVLVKLAAHFYSHRSAIAALEQAVLAYRRALLPPLPPSVAPHHLTAAGMSLARALTVLAAHMLAVLPPGTEAWLAGPGDAMREAISLLEAVAEQQDVDRAPAEDLIDTLLALVDAACALGGIAPDLEMASNQYDIARDALERTYLLYPYAPSVTRELAIHIASASTALQRVQRLFTLGAPLAEKEVEHAVEELENVVELEKTVAAQTGADGQTGRHDRTVAALFQLAEGQASLAHLLRRDVQRAKEKSAQASAADLFGPASPLRAPSTFRPKHRRSRSTTPVLTTTGATPTSSSPSSPLPSPLLAPSTFAPSHRRRSSTSPSHSPPSASRRSSILLDLPAHRRAASEASFIARRQQRAADGSATISLGPSHKAQLGLASPRRLSLARLIPQRSSTDPGPGGLLTPPLTPGTTSWPGEAGKRDSGEGTDYNFTVTCPPTPPDSSRGSVGTMDPVFEFTFTSPTPHSSSLALSAASDLPSPSLPLPTSVLPHIRKPSVGTIFPLEEVDESDEADDGVGASELKPSITQPSFFASSRARFRRAASMPRMPWTTTSAEQDSPVPKRDKRIAHLLSAAVAAAEDALTLLTSSFISTTLSHTELSAVRAALNNRLSRLCLAQAREGSSHLGARAEAHTYWAARDAGWGWIAEGRERDESTECEERDGWWEGRERGVEGVCSALRARWFCATGSEIDSATKVSARQAIDKTIRALRDQTTIQLVEISYFLRTIEAEEGKMESAEARFWEDVVHRIGESAGARRWRDEQEDDVMSELLLIGTL